MKKIDFMQRLSDELQKRNVADAADILQEYEAHFAMKMADGYIEEEIAARLGDPAALAAQFDDAEEAPEKKGGSKPLVVAGLGFADVFAGLFFILLASWGLVLAAAALGSVGVAVCLLGKVELGGLLPEIPYWCGAILALTLAALAVLLAAGCVYFCAFLRQLIRSYGRFRKNALAAASGEAELPPLPISPQLSGKARRRLRTVALLALALFAACFVLTYLVCALSAGSVQFWHAWGWFAN